MKLTSSILAMVSCTMMMVKGHCLPNGCWYDIGDGLTKQINCLTDGSTEILYFYGNNGCDTNWAADRLPFISLLDNPCCTINGDGDEVVVVLCSNNNKCKDDEYCDNGECTDNPCYISDKAQTLSCEGANDCPANDGTKCSCSDAIPDEEKRKCVPAANDVAPAPPALCTTHSQCKLDEYCNVGECTSNPCYIENDVNTVSCSDNGDCNSGNNNCYCDAGESLKCVPVGAEFASSTSYSISIENESGQDQTIGIYQESPIDGEGYPIIFASTTIESGGTGYFKWEINWGLSWSAGIPGDACQPLQGNVEYDRTGATILVTPLSNSPNGAFITYNSEEGGTWDISSKSYSSLTNGELETDTDNNFDTIIATKQCFSLSVTQTDSSGDIATIFAIDGLPNDHYVFSLKPTYYLSTHKTIKGNTVDVSVTSNPTQVSFISGTNDIECKLTSHDVITC